MIHVSMLQRLQHDVEHLHSLGARAEAEFLLELADMIDGFPAILALLHEYRRITPRMVRLAGGDVFPPPALSLVPRQVQQ